MLRDQGVQAVQRMVGEHVVVEDRPVGMGLDANVLKKADGQPTVCKRCNQLVAHDPDVLQRLVTGLVEAVNPIGRRPERVKDRHGGGLRFISHLAGPSSPFIYRRWDLVSPICVGDVLRLSLRFFHAFSKWWGTPAGFLAYLTFHGCMARLGTA